MKPRFSLPRWPVISLEKRLVLILAGIISLILGGQTLIALSGEVADVDHHVAADGRVLAQTIASSCVTLIDGDNPKRFEHIIERVGRVVELVELSIVNRERRVIGHTDPSQVGRVRLDEPSGAFGIPRPSPGLLGLFESRTEYTVSAPIMQGTNYLGFVEFRFQSDEVAQRATRLIGSAAGMALLWLLVGALVGRVYVRRITRPLNTLTLAAKAITDDRLDEAHIDQPSSMDEVGVLQTSFIHLLAALRAERDENARLLAEREEMNVLLGQRVDEVTAELRETTNYLQSVIHCMEEGVITCDADGCVVQANDGATKQLAGIGRPQAGASLADTLAEGERVAAAVKQVIESGEASQIELEIPMGPRPAETGEIPLDVRIKWVVFRIYPLRDVDGAPLGAVITVIDETEQREVERSLRRHDHLVSLGTIAAGIAHEMGNRMHVINGFSKLMLKQLAADHPARADAQAIADENARAIGLLDRFLQFARPKQAHYHPASIDSIVRRAIEICGYQLRASGVTVEDQLATEEHPVSCASDLLEQVFVAMILNAVDAMASRDKKKLTIASRVTDDEQIQVLLRDSGSGIAPDHLERIFDPFFTTKTATGTGLGLSIAHQIIDRHQGTISVQSEVDVGTTFAVTLPTAREKVGAA